MKSAYIECNMGAAGDMLLSALVGLMPRKDEFLNELNSIGIEGVEYILEEKMQTGIKGLHIKVQINGETEKAAGSDIHSHHHSHEHHHNAESLESNHHIHEHSSFISIKDKLSKLNLPDNVKADAIAVYRLIAEAEATVHNTTVNEIHFHELGEKDALADICGVCLAIYKLNLNNISASPINTGSGFVKISHGIVSVPAPATALLLHGIPSYSSGIRSELCTPTGAALLKYFCKEFVDRPIMNISKVSYGFGTKEFEKLNAVRVFLFDEDKTLYIKDKMYEVSTNLDDTTPEVLSLVMNELFDKGAKEVYFTPIYMKKSRPAFKLSFLCEIDKLNLLSQIIFRQTSAIGLRYLIVDRYKLPRNIEEINTAYGKVRVKFSDTGEEIKAKPEFDDMEKLSKETGKSIYTINKEVMRNI